jgi:hypothetical protein
MLVIGVGGTRLPTTTVHWPTLSVPSIAFSVVVGVVCQFPVAMVDAGKKGSGVGKGTFTPSQGPTSRAPTRRPTLAPTSDATNLPSQEPTNTPTSSPTLLFTRTPTSTPTRVLTTDAPTLAPVNRPTGASTSAPTRAPTNTRAPSTLSPTARPTPLPSAYPIGTPTEGPTAPPTAPTKSPTAARISGASTTGRSNGGGIPSSIIITIVVVILCIVGAVVISTCRRLAKVATSDLADDPAGNATFNPLYPSGGDPAPTVDPAPHTPLTGPHMVHATLTGQNLQSRTAPACGSTDGPPTHGGIPDAAYDEVAPSESTQYATVVRAYGDVARPKPHTELYSTLASRSAPPAPDATYDNPRPITPPPAPSGEYMAVAGQYSSADAVGGESQYAVLFGDLTCPPESVHVSTAARLSASAAPEAVYTDPHPVTSPSAPSGEYMAVAGQYSSRSSADAVGGGSQYSVLFGDLARSNSSTEHDSTQAGSSTLPTPEVMYDDSHPVNPPPTLSSSAEYMSLAMQYGAHGASGMRGGYAALTPRGAGGLVDPTYTEPEPCFGFDEPTA